MIGLGLGLCMQTMMLAVQNTVPAKDMGVATSSATFFRQLGGTLGVAVFLSLLFSTVGDKIASAFRDARVPPRLPGRAARPGGTGRPGQQAGARRCCSSRCAAAARPACSATRRSSSTSTRGWPSRSSRASPTPCTLVFLAGRCGRARRAFLLVLFIKEVPLRKLSGLQARAEAMQKEAAAQAAAPEPKEEPATVRPDSSIGGPQGD